MREPIFCWISANTPAKEGEPNEVPPAAIKDSLWRSGDRW